VRVFISSVITGYEIFRDAAAAAIESLGHEVIRAEDFGASPATPQQACLGGVREADAVVLLVGARYGAAQPSGLSATHEEYHEARESKPLLVFVECGAVREPEQEAFLTEVRGWAGGQMTEDFETAEGLRAAVTRQLHRFEMSQQVGTADPNEMQGRAMQLLPGDDRNSHKSALILAVAGGPRQSILRPAKIESTDLYEELLQRASFGPHRLLDTRHGTQRAIRGDALLLEQPDASILLNEEGSVRIMIPAHAQDDDSLTSLMVIIHEVIEERLTQGLRYVDHVLDHIDPTHRLTRLAIVVAVHGAEHMGWRSRAEHVRSPNSVHISTRATGGAVGLAPPDRARGALRTSAHEIAVDLAIRLRRKQQG
jgi:hypothetical protein